MSFALDREKDLPLTPVDYINASSTVEDDDELWSIPCSRSTSFADMNEVLPPIKVESTVSEEETDGLHELWNGAGLSARAERMRRRDQYPTRRRIPAPIYIPDAQNIPPTLTALSTEPSMASRTPTSGTRRRRGFLSARTLSETQEAERKAPNALEKLCAMAQHRLKNKLRYAKSTPNLCNQGVPLGRSVTSLRAVHKPVEAKPKVRETGRPPCPTSASESATPEAALEQQDTDKNAIYFTIGSNWRASRGSVEFECITPVPDSLTTFGRPDSPLLHRHYSLDQLSFAAQKAAMECCEVDSRDEVLELIDELYAYLLEQV